MDKAICLMRALEFIERHLFDALSLEEVAQAALMSLPHLHRVFSRAFHCSLKEYIIKRRLCAAAKAMVEGGSSVTECAFMCRYESVESFTRAFKKQFLTTPSAFRRERRFTELYPMMSVEQTLEVNGMSIIKTYDLTALSNRILAAKGTYILDVDIDHLLPINENLGHDAGDAAIAATAARIERGIPQDACFFRIGGDEFIILTGSADPRNAAAIADAILSFADERVTYGDKELTFTVSLGISKVPGDLTDPQTAMDGAQREMFTAKRAGGNTRAGV